MNLSSVHPIDTLLVSQLENILVGEKELSARYSGMPPSAHTPEVLRAFSNEVNSLKARADRLYRLINAMGYYGPGVLEDGMGATPATY